MAVAPSSSPGNLDPKADKEEAEIPQSSSQIPAFAAAENPNPNPNPNHTVVAPPQPPSILPLAPSFRPMGASQYSVLPNPNFSMAMQPPGVNPSMRPMYPYAYGQPPMGYPGAPPPQAPMPMPPFGYARYPVPYPNMVRPGFPPRPMPPVGMIPQLSRPPIPGVRGAPMVTPVIRPVVPIVAPPEKPQTTVYVGKIAPSADNEFLLSLLRLCGPVKSWKRAQDPSDGTPKGFGFCEFESAEGILRAMRLLSKLNIDGQELVLNINQATREYLERYVEKKTEREKLKGSEAQASDKETELASGVEQQEPPKPIIEEKDKDGEESDEKENIERTQVFGIVTDEDRDADKDSLEKITNIIEERLKTRPLPPPPPVRVPLDASTKSNSDVPSKSKDGDSDVDILKSDAAEEKNDDETTSENKPGNEHERAATSSPDRGRRHDRRSSKEKERDYDSKREKERDLERYERERERERIRRDRDRELKIREAERQFRERVKEWEAREREREYQRQRERERDKEKEREHKREILKDENDSDDDDTRKRRRRSGTYDEKRRKRYREKEEDSADRLKEEEEIADAKKRAIDEQPLNDGSMLLSGQVINESEKPMNHEMELDVEGRDNDYEQASENVSASGNDNGYEIYKNNTDEPTAEPAAVSDMKLNNNVPARKLGFGIIASGKRTTVPSVFHEEDDEDDDEKKMKPLVPIVYSTEELQAIETSPSGPPPNLLAAAEFAKRISNVNPREDKREIEKERGGRSSDRSSRRDRDRNDDENSRARNGSREKMHDKVFDRERSREDRPKTENKKLLDAKQLIDMIPKTKEDLFAYEINWAIYDKHELHGRMRPWIAKKVTEFLGEEESTLVDYIVSSTKDHVHASKMLELLQSILDDEAEMFVLKMWRMLIFEIKKVEAGLSGKPRG